MQIAKKLLKPAEDITVHFKFFLIFEVNHVKSNDFKRLLYLLVFHYSFFITTVPNLNLCFIVPIIYTYLVRFVLYWRF